MMIKKFFQIVIFLTLSSSAFSQSKFTEQTKVYFDSIRNRKLVTEIWSPETNSISLPLVMFSHGTGGNRLACSWFCEGLAEKGFIIVAIDHFGNTFDNPIPKEFVTFWQRPQDISFVLSELLKDQSYSSKIDPNKIYMAGFSIGGYTSLALAGAKLNWNNIIQFSKTPQGVKEINVPEMPGLLQMYQQDSVVQSFKNSPDLLDKRFKAVFVMSPAAGQGFSSKKQMKRVKVPIFIIGAEADSVAPIKTNALHYKKLLPKAMWYLVKGKAGHYVFLNEGTEELRKNMPVFFKDDESVNRSEIHRQMIEKAEIFFKTTNR